MAQVSYNPFSNAEPNAAPPDDYQRIQANPSSFGGDIAAGAQKLGAGMLDASKFWGQVQTDDVLNQTLPQLDANLTTFRSLEGQAALDKQAEFEQTQKQIIEQAKGRLATPEAQLAFTKAAIPYQQRLTQIAATHVVDQGKAVVKNVNDVAYGTAINHAAMYYTQPDMFQAAVGDATAARIKNLQDRGLDTPEARAEARRTATADAVKAASEAAMAQHPDISLRMLDANKEALGAEYGSLRIRAQAQADKHAGNDAANDLWAAAGTPAAGPAATAAAPRAVGDSLAEGVKTTAKLEGDTRVGRPSSHVPTGPHDRPGVLQVIEAMPRAVSNQPVILSSGLSNDGANADPKVVEKQIAALRSKGYSDIRVLGVGDKFASLNPAIKQIAEASGAKFVPIGANDGVHPTDGYKAATAAAVGAVPARAAGGGGYAPGGFASALGRTFFEEGGFNSKDANGAPVNFGINQAAHPEVDVRNLTRAQAAAIYKRDYWDAIGGDALAAQNPGLAHIAFDTAVVEGSARAKQWLEQAGGDPQKFMALREAWERGLVARDPSTYAKYARTWQNRREHLMADIGAGGSFVPSPAGAPAFPGVTPAAYTPPSAGAAPTPTPVSDAVPPPPSAPAGLTPEPDPERAAYEQYARALTMLNERNLSFDQQQIAEHKLSARLNLALAEAGVAARQKKEREDEDTNQVLGIARKQGPKAAYQYLETRLNDVKNPMSEKLYATLSKSIEQDSNDPNPREYGPGYTAALKGVLAPAKDPSHIGTVRQLLEMKVDGQITQKGFNDLAHSMQLLEKSEDEYGLQEMRRQGLDALKRKFSVESINPVTGKPMEMDPHGLDLYETVGIARYNSAFTAWRQSVKEGKADPSDFPLSDPKKLEAFAESIYPSRQRAYLRMQAQNPSLPDIPPRVDPKGWGEVFGLAKTNQEKFGEALAQLAADPDANIPFWNASPLGRVIRAQDALTKMGVPYAAQPTPEPRPAPSATATPTPAPSRVLLRNEPPPKPALPPGQPTDLNPLGLSPYEFDAMRAGMDREANPARNAESRETRRTHQHGRPEK